jgi:hypothetical protein
MLERAFGGGGGVESKRLEKEGGVVGGGEGMRGGDSIRGAAAPLSYTLPHIGAGGTAIAAAASQAIAATQQVSYIPLNIIFKPTASNFFKFIPLFKFLLFNKAKFRTRNQMG